jgi:hypothetical protein
VQRNALLLPRIDPVFGRRWDQSDLGDPARSWLNWDPQTHNIAQMNSAGQPFRGAVKETAGKAVGDAKPRSDATPTRLWARSKTLSAGSETR